MPGTMGHQKELGVIVCYYVLLYIAMYIYILYLLLYIYMCVCVTQCYSLLLFKLHVIYYSRVWVYMSMFFSEDIGSWKL